jgi:hypothetical protein
MLKMPPERFNLQESLLLPIDVALERPGVQVLVHQPGYYNSMRKKS